MTIQLIMMTQYAQHITKFYLLFANVMMFIHLDTIQKYFYYRLVVSNIHLKILYTAYPNY